ncbi:AlwI family type II restriction endonuclease [Peptococcaceae bacterium 1198_IL3148]
MATLRSKTLFFVTSPRTPFKMLPEVKLLVEEFSDKTWNTDTQSQFAQRLSDAIFFAGTAVKDKAFSARDRINRAPKALGFVNLKPTIQLTEPGRQLLYGKRPYEIFTRQLLKFQLPSPFHKDPHNVFNVKPYLEILRLIYDLGSLSKDEIKVFAIQLTDYQKYDVIKNKIKQFRQDLLNLDRNVTNYKRFLYSTLLNETMKIYCAEIKTGNIKTRESSEKSVASFIKTKMDNARDYADACFRYLRATELVVASKSGAYLKVSDDKIADVEYIIKTVDRKPTNFLNEKEYKAYLFNPNTPILITDDKVSIIKTIERYGIKQELYNKLSLEQLKDYRDDLIANKRKENVAKNAIELRTYNQYSEIISLFKQLMGKRVPVDSPLLLEWNVWRAFAMLNDGQIEGNFKVDDEGTPLMTAPGNKPDIECRYKDFNSIIEVTMSTGQKQYEMEGEPVARHLGKFKKENKSKDTFGIFIAKSINDATLAHFYTLHKVPVSYYGGISKIIPLDIETLIKMLTVANSCKQKPSSKHLLNFLKTAAEASNTATDEKNWYDEIKRLAKEWVDLTNRGYIA